MEMQLHLKYINIEFSTDQISMFADIVEEDLAMKRTLLTIAQHADAHKNESDLNSGISIKQISEKVIINRRVQKEGKSKKYITSDTNIDRKHAERIVDSLLNMTLCYYKSFHPTKVLYLTARGRSIATELIRRQRNKTI